MKIGFITTARADFGIYLPLIKAVAQRDGLEYLIFAGGMHLSEKFGYTYKMIEQEGFQITEKVASLSDDDSPEGIALSMSETLRNFAAVWANYQSQLDLLFVLGDRFEMFAAAASVTPFNIPLAHLHGGEATLGAIDNKFRNAITAMADYHFASHPQHAKRISEIIGSDKHVYNVGALGLDAIRTAAYFTPDEFFEKYGLQNQQFVLVTYHPETINLNNAQHIHELIEALKQIPEKALCTLPNADTQGSIIREAVLKYEQENPEKIVCYENLGQKGYLSAMKYCKLMIGNTSSGIIEAASFHKYVINVGDRQKGRLCAKNVMHVSNKRDEILNAYQHIDFSQEPNVQNPYGDSNAAKKILTIINTELKIGSGELS